MSVALCVVNGERRALTAAECEALHRWAITVQTAALDAVDGGTTLAVVFG